MAKSKREGLCGNLSKSKLLLSTKSLPNSVSAIFWNSLQASPESRSVRLSKSLPENLSATLCEGQLSASQCCQSQDGLCLLGTVTNITICMQGFSSVTWAAGTCVSSNGAASTGCTNGTFARACNTAPCAPTAWQVGPWGACSKTCADRHGAGTQTRTVGCYQYANSNSTSLVGFKLHLLASYLAESSLCDRAVALAQNLVEQS